MRSSAGLAVVILCLVPVSGAAAGSGVLTFREASEELGLVFRHHHGGSGSFYMPETMGSGVAVLDYDDDGDEDVLYIDSGALPGYTGEPGRSVLYRNDGGRFVDVTARARLTVASYGMGVTAGDIDGDADLDVYVTAFGPNHLFENLGDGTFREIGAAAGVDDASWGASAAFADADLDGDLDLYVTNYVDFSFEDNPICGDQLRGLRSYCHPDVYDGLADRYFRNRGDGTFEDATAAAGFGEARGAGLGVVFGDVDADGWPDLYVANDMTPNFLFRGGADGVFEETALVAGVALGLRGEPEAGMGLAMGDVDGDGLPEIHVTHLDRQTNALYSSRGDGLFLDRRFVSRVAEPSIDKVGFGTELADLDLDGDLDLVVANGHIIHNVEQLGQGGHYRQRNQVLVNLGDGRFEEALDVGMDVIRASRGLAVGDLDGDGDPDVVITNSNDLAEVYVNESRPTGGWLRLVLRSPRGAGGTAALGSAIRLSAAERTQHRELRSASSYLSQSAAGAHFGLGDADRAAIDLRWPDGRRQRLAAVPANRRLVVTRAR
jgi:hypothetical protein